MKEVYNLVNIQIYKASQKSRTDNCAYCQQKISAYHTYIFSIFRTHMTKSLQPNEKEQMYNS